VNHWKSAGDLKEKGESFVVVTLISIRGSAPQDPGAKMIVSKQGLYSGTVGGGKVELAAISKALSVLCSNKSLTPELVTWNLQTDIGMSCGGEVTFLFEYHMNSNWPIVIFGAGHVAQALTRILTKLDCQVTCIDSREDWVNKLEGVRGICSSEPKDLVKTFNPQSYFLSMTMGHAHDVPILLEIATHASSAPYVGVIGSEIKGKKIKRELHQLGVSETFLEKLKVPIGLPLGTNHPYEIAISIVAELLQVRDSLQSFVD